MIQQENHSNQQPNRSNQQPEQQSPEQYRYQRKYPRFSSVRLSHANINRIKSRSTRFNQTIDDIVTLMLGQLDYYDRIGYPDAPHGERSF
jgi:hypothetical protein